jgi:DNA-directed RNA polymerase subunit M/transcription elongation factor TFIIS
MFAREKMIQREVYITMPDKSFCPDCQTLLSTNKDDAEGSVLLKCPNCNFSRPIETLHIIHSNTFKDDHGTQHIPYATIFDPAVKRTTRVPCSDSECPTRDPAKWGTFNERGIKVEPSVLIATVYDPNRLATYVCRICGNIFKPASVSL